MDLAQSIQPAAAKTDKPPSDSTEPDVLARPDTSSFSDKETQTPGDVFKPKLNTESLADDDNNSIVVNLIDSEQNPKSTNANLATTSDNKPKTGVSSTNSSSTPSSPSPPPTKPSHSSGKFWAGLAAVLLLVLIGGFWLKSHIDQRAARLAEEQTKLEQQLNEQRRIAKLDIGKLSTDLDEIEKLTASNDDTVSDEGSTTVVGQTTTSELLATGAGDFDSLVVQGATSSGDLSVSGDTTLAELIVDGQIVLTGNNDDLLLINADSSSQDLVTITQPGGSDAFSVDGSGNVTIAGDTAIGGVLQVSQEATFSANAIINGALTVDGGTTFNGSLSGVSATFSGGASFGSAVSGSDATSADEFITLGQLNSTAASSYFMQNGNSFGATASLGTNDNNALAIETNGSERLRISASGNIGIGDNSPAYLLTVGSDDMFGVDSSGNLQWEGTTADGFETTLSVVDPTADVTYRLVNPAGGAGTYDICTSDNNCSSGAFTSSAGLTYLNTVTDSVTIGSSTELAKLAVDGDSDEVQLLIQGNSTQTTNLLVLEQSDGTNVLTVNNAGDATLNGAVTLGDATSDTVIFNGYVGSSILPDTTNTYDLGSSTQRWRDLYLGPGSLHIGDDAEEGVIGFDSANNYLYLSSSGSPTEEIVITSDTGRIGIGNNAPQAKLHIGEGAAAPFTYSDGFEDSTLEPFTTSGGWSVVTGASPNSGNAHVRSTSGTNSATYDMELTKTIASGGGEISFYIKTSVSTSNQSHTFWIDGVQVQVLPDSTGGSWELHTFGVSAGEHTFRWRKSNYACCSGGSFNVDDVQITNMVDTDSPSAIIDGRLGIDTVSPGSKLEVQGGASPTEALVNIGGTQDGALRVRNIEGKNSSSTAVGELLLNSNNAFNVVAVDGGGNLGVGVASPTARLTVGSDGAFFNDGFEDTTLDPFTTSGNWAVVTGASPNSGSAHVRSTSGTNSANYDLELSQEIAVGGGEISFYIKTSVSTSNQSHTFWIDGVQTQVLPDSTGGDWEQFTFSVTEGAHTFRWRKSNYACCNGGSFNVDDVQVTNTVSTSATSALFSGGIGIGVSSINEQLTLNGSLSLQEVTAPSLTSGFGKLFVKSADSKLYFLDDSGVEHDILSAGGAGVNSVGTIDSQTKSDDGAVISGTTIILQTADASYPGLVSIGAQTFAGDKTLQNSLTVSGTTNLNGAINLGDDTGDTVTFTGYVGSNILPATDDTYDLGSSTLRWQDLYLGPNSLHIGTNGDEGIISYDTTNNEFDFDQNINAAGILEIKGTPNGGSSTQGSLIVNPVSKSSSPDVEWTYKSAWDIPDTGLYHTPTFGDLDNDDDLDMIVGDFNGESFAYENTGTVTSPTWTYKSAWNVPAPNGTDDSAPALVDLDNDNDLDVLVGASNGVTYAYENTGTVSSPTWTYRSGWNAPDVGSEATPSVGDLDGDGDMDLMIGDQSGVVNGVQNIGSVTSPSWTVTTGWNSPDVGSWPDPALGDLDLDGDLDLIIGDNNAYDPPQSTFAYENTGTPLAPTWTRMTNWDNDPVPCCQSYAGPGFADLDNDGDLDVIIGVSNGGYAYENTGSAGGGFNNTLFGVAVNNSSKLRVNAAGSLQVSTNSDIYTGLEINQYGTGNILQLKDSETTVLSVADGGDTTLSGNFLPGTDDTYDLGSSTNRFRDLYLGPASLHIGVDGNEGSIGYDTTDSTLVFGGVSTTGLGLSNLVIDANNKVWQASSSSRYKSDIRDLEDDFSKILNISPKAYTDNATGKQAIGVIAEELDAAGLGKLVIYNNQGQPDGVKYDRIPLYLLEVVKEQQTAIDSLSASSSDSTKYLQNGDSASFASLNVSGATTLNGTLSVKGSANFSKNVTVKGNIYADSLIISRTVDTEQPQINALSALGELTATAEITGTDTAGTITITTGTSPNSGELAEVTFNQDYGNAVPRIVLQPLNDQAVGVQVYIEKTDTGFKLVTNDDLQSDTVYEYDYIIIGSTTTQQ